MAEGPRAPTPAGRRGRGFQGLRELVGRAEGESDAVTWSGDRKPLLGGGMLKDQGREAEA